MSKMKIRSERKIQSASSNQVLNCVWKTKHYFSQLSVITSLKENEEEMRNRIYIWFNYFMTSSTSTINNFWFGSFILKNIAFEGFASFESKYKLSLRQLYDEIWSLLAKYLVRHVSVFVGNFSFLCNGTSCISGFSGFFTRV